MQTYDETIPTMGAAPSAQAVRPPDVHHTASLQLGSPAVAAEWTQAGDGLLVADAVGSVSMWATCHNEGHAGDSPIAVDSSSDIASTHFCMAWRSVGTVQQASCVF